ncbi:MAG: DUF423 domain-containing protein [Ignavibacteriae bacterium]|nr:MAG: DUF423 domain-containing protein [Ignavibacteriota bacterium]
MSPLNNWIRIGAISGFLAVALGAFGAHGLKNIVTPEMLETYRTGVLYHLIHSVVILAIGFYGNERLKIAALFFLLGIILFSFSLYAYSVTGMKALAMITPVGGVSFLIGWVLTAVRAKRA